MIQPAPKKYPDREEIMDRMILRFGPMINRAVVPLVGLCAEEAEKVMMEALLKKESDKVKIYKDRTYVAITKPTRRNSCWCYVCKAHSIYFTHSFCPGCGSKILWMDRPG